MAIDNMDVLLNDLTEVAGDLAQDGLAMRDVPVGVLLILPDGKEVMCKIIDQTVARYIDIDDDVQKMWIVAHLENGQTIN